MNGPNTKDKIIIVATELFSQFGFDGTSIRDIANKADVNISAVNYHFTNKENLYHEIFDRNYAWMKETISNIKNVEKISTSDLIFEVFTIFTANSHKLRNCFKIMLTGSISIDPHKLHNCDKTPFGPPGADTVIKTITREVGEKIPYEAREWACHHMLVHINHLTLLLSSSYMKEKIKCNMQVTPKKIKQSIQLFVEALLNQIKNHPKKWE